MALCGGDLEQEPQGSASRAVPGVDVEQIVPALLPPLDAQLVTSTTSSLLVPADFQAPSWARTYVLVSTVPRGAWHTVAKSPMRLHHQQPRGDCGPCACPCPSLLNGENAGVRFMSAVGRKATSSRSPGLWPLGWVGTVAFPARSLSAPRHQASKEFLWNSFTQGGLARWAVGR